MKPNELFFPVRIAVFFALLMPAAMLSNDFYAGTMASPFRTIVQETGLWSIRMLVLGLLIGPLRDVTGWTWPLALRRMVGLYAFFYAVVHVVAWTRQYGFDWSFLLGEALHLWLFVGVLAVLALLPLAATSASIMHKLVGPAMWGRIHKLVYAAAVLALVHYTMARGFTRIEVGIDILLIGAALIWRQVGPKPKRPPLSAPSPSRPA